MATLDTEKADNVAEFEKSLIHVIKVTATGDAYSGSASFVDIPSLPDESWDYIVSATHVFTDGSNLNTTAYLHTITPDNEILNINVSTSMVVYSVAADICVLRVPKKPGRVKLGISNMSNVRVGTSLYCLGFTAGDDYQNTTICNIKDLSYNNKECPPSSILVDSVTMMGGNSGGPWVDREGNLVAIASWGYSSPSSSFADSFDIFGVSVLSLNRLLDKYSGQGSTPYRYMGKTVDGTNTSIRDVELINIINNFPWHTKLSGVFLDPTGSQHVIALPPGSIITEILTIDGKWEEIGMMNSQYKNWDLDIFYATSSNIQVKYITSANPSGTTASLPIRVRNTLEDQEFEYLSTRGKKIL